jgi:hypothetical protein
VFAALLLLWNSLAEVYKGVVRATGEEVALKKITMVCMYVSARCSSQQT